MRRAQGGCLSKAHMKSECQAIEAKGHMGREQKVTLQAAAGYDLVVLPRWTGYIEFQG